MTEREELEYRPVPVCLLRDREVATEADREDKREEGGAYSEAGRGG